MTSIEGNRGEPRPRPPFPALKGFSDKPTILNNVETYANIPADHSQRARSGFASMGTEKSKGTKVFALGGKIHNTGLVEIPMGTTLREIVEEIGGGIPNGKKFKAAQTGGPSGGCIPAEHSDMPDRLRQPHRDRLHDGFRRSDRHGRGHLHGGYCQVLSGVHCGRDPAASVHPAVSAPSVCCEILNKITKGTGALWKTWTSWKTCATTSRRTLLCGLGQTAPNPVLSTLSTSVTNISPISRTNNVPPGVCKELLHYMPSTRINARAVPCAPETARRAPLPAPSRKPMSIDTGKCVKCGACMEKVQLRRDCQKVRRCDRMDMVNVKING